MKRIALLLSIVLTFVTLKAADPDFAYPKTTLDNALKHYNSAISSASTSGITLIKSLLEIAGATAAIDPDSIVNVIPRVDRAIAVYPDGTDKALLLTIKAELLNSIYSQNRWKYDQTETPDEPLPADITEWNGRQFQAQINSVISVAFEMAAKSQTANIANYAQVIKANKLTRQFFPTIASFIASKAASLINSHQYRSDIQPIIDKMLTLSKPKSDAEFYWTDKRLELTTESYNNLQNERKRLYLENSEYEAAGYILSRIDAGYYHNSDGAKWLLQQLRSFIERFPSYWDINALKNSVAVLTTPEVSLKCNRIVAPNIAFDLKVHHSYTQNIGYTIYKISEKDFPRYNFDKSETVKIKSFSTITDPKVADGDTIFKVSIPEQGYYVLVPSINGELSTDYRLRLICAPYVPTLLEQTSTSAIIVSDYQTGAPIEGALVTEKISKNSYELGNTVKTGAVKFIPHVIGWEGYSYDITYKDNTLNFFSNSRYIRNDNIPESDEILIITDRNLYHPGDTVQWAAVAYISRKKSRLMTNQSIFVEFLNANNQLVDSARIKTDDFGRISGTFVAPMDGLTGEFKIRAKKDEKLALRASQAFIEISDFKLPTFKIGNVNVQKGMPNKGDITLTAEVMTYSGMPVIGAKVEAEIWEASRWRWFSPNKKIGIINGTIDNEGHLNIVVPDSITSQSSNGCFYANISVAASDGEVRYATASFTLGKPYMIDFSGNKNIINIDRPLSQPFKAYDANGKEVEIDVRWWLTPAEGDHNKATAIAAGECTTGKTASIDLSNVGAGEWCVSVEPVDSTLADTNLNAATITTYSYAKNLIPAGNDIFVPDNRVTANHEGKFSITFGVENDSTYIYCSLAFDRKQQDLSVDLTNKGFHTIDFVLPYDQETGNVILYTVRNGFQTQQSIYIKREKTNTLTLSCETIRDRLIPGSTERLKLILSDRNGIGQTGAMVATMFNSALNDLTNYSLPSGFSLPSLSTYQDISLVSRLLNASISASIKRLQKANLMQPNFSPSISTYDLIRYKQIQIRGSKASGEVTAILGTEDEVYQEVAMLGAADMATNGELVEGEEYDEIHSPEDAQNQKSASQEFDYREGEVLQALWRPAMTFNEKGETVIEFDVPNAFGAWSFNAFAWTQDLRAATLVREFIAAKPVMVQPNLPRFLRVGDTAKILATVYNNSDSTATIKTVVEIFDITTGEIKSQFESNDEVGAKGSTIVKADIAGDGDVAAIGYRVRSTLGRFTDGEQDYIPVIASDSKLIESQNFYLNPGEANVEIKIPDGKKMTSTFEYTANPAWNIIKELPGLSTSEGWTAPGVSRRLFAAATAAGLLKTYPELAEVIKTWSEDPDSKALISRLAQNDELKAAVLNATPWVQAAAGDTERMARLSLLFDKKATEKTISSAISTLKKLQKPNGGWAWGEWCKDASLWSTEIVLQDLGRLNAIGYLPEDKDLKDMIAKAISYCESCIPKDVITNEAFTFIITLFPDAQLSMRGKQIINATVQEIIGSWKSSSIWMKSLETIILAANGHKNVAGQIVNSISEFAVSSPNKGVTFPSDNNINDYADILYAISKVAPDSKLIDGIRQAIVVRQQVTEQLGSFDPTRLIAAFVTSGSKWLSNDEVKTNIQIGGNILDIPNQEFATGHLVYNLPSSAGGKKLEFNRGNSSVPAYGSVISRYTAKSTDIKAKSCDDLSIEKRVTALRNGKWQYVDNVKLGEQVKVLLTIKSKRDLQYVTVIDERPASFEPVEQLPGWVWSAGAGFYRENRDAVTNLFIDYLPKGTYQITIDMTASIAGEFTSGVATVQSQLAPSITAHSAGSILVCED